jgi:phosphate transport system substrate-binding protein
MKKEMKKFARDVKAISPVIATLMLVLIAVASASAFYIWQSGWQEDAQDNMGDSDVKTNMIISGSTTVTPFMDTAAQAFMLENPTYKVTVQGIGSGPGKSATLQGKCDIGMSSSALTQADLDAGLVQTTVGYDGIVMFVSANTYAKLDAMGVDAKDIKNNVTSAFLQDIYKKASTISTLGQLAVRLNSSATIVTADSNTVFKTVDRAEESGTEEGFCKMAGLGGIQLPATVLSIEYAADQSENGNSGVIAYVKANVAIGFTSYGMVASDSSCKYFGYNEGAAGSLTGLMPTPANIKAGAVNPSDNVNGYGAARLLVVCTLGEPTGDVLYFIEFITNPQNNMDFCAEVGYVSII